jgi:hypothetical protein
MEETQQQQQQQERGGRDLLQVEATYKHDINKSAECFNTKIYKILKYCLNPRNQSTK